jgi:hypothetical protein
LHKESYVEKIPRAKAQSAAASLGAFLCAFAPLREKNLFLALHRFFAKQRRQPFKKTTPD